MWEPILQKKLLIYRKMMPRMLKSPCYKPSPYWNCWISNKTQMKQKIFKIVQPCDLPKSSCAANIFQFLLQVILSMVFCGKTKIIFWRGSEKLRMKEWSLIWSKAFITHRILQDATITRFNWWLWQWLTVHNVLIDSKLICWKATEMTRNWSSSILP